MQHNIEITGKDSNTIVTLVSVSSSILKEPKPLVYKGNPVLPIKFLVEKKKGGGVFSEAFEAD